MGTIGEARRVAAIRTLAVDAQTAEVVSALRSRGVEALLLKGPAVARLLYADSEQRTYGDSDLLVSPRTFRAAEEALRGLGYERDLGVRSMALAGIHGYPWHRPGTTLAVDLHHTLAGVEEDPQRLWEVLRGHIVRMELCETTVAVLDAPAQALHVALHAAQHGSAEKKPLRDLDRALDLLGMRVWRETVELATSLHAVDAFGAGLRLLPRGEAMAAELRLPPNRSRGVALYAMGSPSLAVAVNRFLATPGVRPRATLLLNKTCPPADFMRFGSPLARRGRAGLVLAYLWRLVRILGEVVPSVRAWRQADKGTAKLFPNGGRA